MTADSSKTNVLITGPNRGIGKGFVQTYLSRPDHTVIAAVRDLSTSQALGQLPVATGSRLVVVKIDATVESDAAAAVKQLVDSEQPIDHLDVVIANAGYCVKWPAVAELQIDDMLDCLRPNVFGVVWLYQATRALLNKSNNPKWVTIGSTGGSIEVRRRRHPFVLGQLDGPSAAYGPSKAAVHWLTKRINGEEEKFTSFVLHPGFVATDMGNLAAGLLGMEHAPVSIEDSVGGMLRIIDNATKEKHGAKFFEYDGKPYPW